VNPTEPFLFEDFSRAKSEISDAIESAQHFILLSGESGSGKTSLLRSLRQTLDRVRFRILYFHMARLGPAGLIRVLARHLRIPACRSQPETVQEITKTIAEDLGQMQLWIDEANLLEDDTFSELRTLAEADLEKDCGLTILFAGLPTLRDRLQSPRLFPLWRRIEGRVEIAGLKRHESAPFIAHHLGPQTAARFDEGALAVLSDHSRGMPGLLLPYAKRVLREVPSGSISADRVEAVLQQWNLA
jgi:type II secretory pathway predicted ATPase ExeA